MDKTYSRAESKQAGQIHQTEIELPANLQAELDAIPDKLINAQVVWTERQLKLLLAGWGRKTQANMARLVGHCIESCKTKYDELTEES